MSKHSVTTTKPLGDGFERFMAASARADALLGTNAVLLDAVLGEGAGTWSKDIIGGLFESQRIHIDYLREEIDALRIEAHALTRREAA